MAVYIEGIELTDPEIPSVNTLSSVVDNVAPVSMANTLPVESIPNGRIGHGAAQSPQVLLLERCMLAVTFSAANLLVLLVLSWGFSMLGDNPMLRLLFLWGPAAIALPTLAFAGRPFLFDALKELMRGRYTEDASLSVALLSLAGVSVWEALHGGEHLYFSTLVMVLFFLLAGRYLEQAVHTDNAISVAADDGTVKDVPTVKDAAQRSGDIALFVFFVTVAIAGSAWYWLLMPWQQAVTIGAAMLVASSAHALFSNAAAVYALGRLRLTQHGVILRKGDALSRLARIRHIVLRKRDVVTIGAPKLLKKGSYGAQALQMAASLAAYSNHPMAKVLVENYRGPVKELKGEEIPGCGVKAQLDTGEIVRLGRLEWPGDRPIDDSPSLCKLVPQAHSTLWLREEGKALVPFYFEYTFREDAEWSIKALNARRYAVTLLSADHTSAVEATAELLGISHYHAERPQGKGHPLEVGKVAVIAATDHKDAPAGDILLSPVGSEAAARADITYQSDRLWPVIDACDIAHYVQWHSKVLFWLVIAYNLAVVPLALAGILSPVGGAMASAAFAVFLARRSCRLKAQTRLPLAKV